MRPRLWMAFVLIFTMVAQVSAQSELKKAEKLLKLKAFDLAIKNYKTALVKHPDNADGYAQLGEAYLMTNQLLDALKSYERAFALEGTVDSKYKLQYATALKKVGLYDLAESVFFEYASVDQNVANHMLASTEYAKSLLQKPDEYDIVTFDHNSSSSDFGVAFFKDQVVFCSFRDDLMRDNDKKNQSHIQQKGNQLYTVAQVSGGQSPDFLRPDYKEIYNIGPLSYSKDGGMVSFMRNTFTTGSNQIFSDESNMSIYVAFTTEDGDFTDEKPFPYNQIEYSYAFPNLGFDGSALYFASNRPGGLGGFDLYVSYFQEGKWSRPENLGPEVNTVGNEITPFFDGDKLYFASDYHFGLGGYDNFSATVNNGIWSQPQNLGKGINSPSDDYYLSPDLQGNTLYFSSNRLGGSGKDDIYIGYPLLQQEEAPLAVIEEYAVPQAVNLDDLAQEVRSDISSTSVNTTSQNQANPSIVAVSSGESVAIISETALSDFSGAKLTAITTPSLPDVGPVDEWAEVFFIQLASLSRSEGQIERYERLSSYGRLYRFFKSSSVKIRLGTFTTRSHAESVLRDVHGKGYRDAFITRDILATSSYELLGSNPDPNAADANAWVNDYNPESSYKVKLASYQDPLKFQVDKVLDLGRLEQWTKGDWTIFIVGGFETIDDAKKARIKAMNRGFVDAEIVQDDAGILSRVSEN